MITKTGFRLTSTIYLMSFLLSAFSPVEAQMVYAEHIPESGKAFGVDVSMLRFVVRDQVIKSSVAANVFTSGEQPEIIIQLVINTQERQFISGNIEFIAYGTQGRPGDVWVPDMFATDHHCNISISVELEPLATDSSRLIGLNIGPTN